MSERLISQSVRRRLAAVAALAAATLGTIVFPAGPAGAEEAPTPSGGASASATEAPPRTRTTFVLGIKQDIDSLNPYVGVVASAFEAYQVMYDTLTFDAAADFSPQPGLAERWENSPDGKTWTFHIRQGVKWSDGQDLTANDVAYSFQRAIDGETENGQYGAYVTLVTKVTATDDYTVVFQTSEASPSMLRMKVPILPEHIWKDIDGEAVATYANDKTPVGSGPFPLTEARTGQFYRFAANKSYWAGAPKIDELVLRIFADDEALVQALKQGEIDMVQDISSAHFDALEERAGHHHELVEVLGLQRARLQPRRRDDRQQGDRRRPPGAAGQAGADRARSRDRSQDAGGEGDGQPRHRGHRRHPADLPGGALEPG